MNDITAAATNAPELPFDHASRSARRVAALQTAIRTGRAYHLETVDTFAVTADAPAAAHIRFDADGTITSVKADGTEKPGARIEKGILRDLADTRLVELWVKHPEIADAL